MDLLSAVATLVAGFVGAGGGVWAAFGQSGANNRLLAETTVSAIKSEIIGLCELFDRLLDTKSTTNLVEFLPQCKTSELCPIYIGTANDIGRIGGKNVDKVVRFYGSFLTLGFQRAQDKMGCLLVSKTDIQYLKKMANDAVLELNQG